MRPLWVIRAGSKCHHQCPYKGRAEGDLRQSRRRMGDHGGKDWRAAATAQSHLEPQELAEAGSILPSSLWRERTPAHTCISHFWPPSVGVFCYGGLKGRRHSHSCQGSTQALELDSLGSSSAKQVLAT